MQHLFFLKIRLLSMWNPSTPKELIKTGQEKLHEKFMGIEMLYPCSILWYCLSQDDSLSFLALAMGLEIPFISPETN